MVIAIIVVKESSPREVFSFRARDKEATDRVTLELNQRSNVPLPILEKSDMEKFFRPVTEIHIWMRSEPAGL
ncbi:hypothetical protein LTR40_007499, partial [Exophiala xenobiotica]